MKQVIKIALLVLVVLGQAVYAQKPGFKQSQMANKRVQKAYETKWPNLLKELKSKNIDPENFDIFIRCFKFEKTLEIWLKNKAETSYLLFKTIPICANSGILGPKRREGDRQVPEGLYDINLFNANSDYHVAMKVSYPNPSDKILAKGPTGGDIMIHGYCCTIGCIPLQNDPVEELYVLCVEAKNRKCPLRVEIYPCHFTEKNWASLKETYEEEKINFWNNLKPAYTYFEENKKPIKYSIDKKGAYVFN